MNFDRVQLKCFLCENSGVHDYFSHAPPLCLEHGRSEGIAFSSFPVWGPGDIESFRGNANICAVVLAKKLLEELTDTHPHWINPDGHGNICFSWKDKDLTVDVTVGSVDFDVIVKEGSDEMTRIDVSLERVLEVLRKAVRKRPRGIP